MKISREAFGLLQDNREASLFKAVNSAGTILKVSDYGGIIQSIQVRDKKGNPGDVVLGFDSLQEYLGEHPYIGAVVGRCAGRISGGRFTLDGTEFLLAQNHGPNHIHGGVTGFDKVLWDAFEFADDKGVGVTMKYFSHDLEEGYPGNLTVSLTYTLDEEDQVCIDYRAATDKPTPLNLTNHSYFNLGGGSSPVYDHEIMINSGSYVVTGPDLIPTGEIRSTEGSALDLRSPKVLGEEIEKVEGGFDHCFIIEGDGEVPVHAATLVHKPSGRVMEVFTTEPGVQFYTGNFLDGTLTGKGGVVYGKHFGFCLETQHFPDSPNQPDFPSTILRPGETYYHFTSYKFSVIQ